MPARRPALIFFAAAFGLRLALVPFPGFKLDIAAFESWARALALAGPGRIYTSALAQPPVDYPPLYLYVLWAAGVVHAHLGAPASHGDLAFRILLKLPPVLADLAAAGLVFALASAAFAPARAGLAALVVLFAPPAWLDSAYWGQIDTVPAALLLAAAWYSVQKRFTPAWLALALAIAIKPQGVVLVPLFAVRQIALEGIRPRLGVAALATAALAYLISLPFAPDRAPPATLSWLAQRYAAGVAKAPHNSEGAFNLYTLFGAFYSSDGSPWLGLPLHTWGLILVGGILGLTSLGLWQATRRAPDERERTVAFLHAATLALAGLFLFGTRMHERYLLAALLFGAVIACEGLPAALAVGALAVTFTVNCAFILAGFSGGAHHPLTVLAGHVLAGVNLIAFAVLATLFVRRLPAAGNAANGALRRSRVPVRTLKKLG